MVNAALHLRRSLLVTGRYYTLCCSPFRTGTAKHTMCVWVDYIDWTFHGKSMGQKGIQTAYVAKGQKGPGKRK
ncbi:hypothetical protein ACQB60_40925 [Actinomycetota bacterium Odt1-20B]